MVEKVNIGGFNLRDKRQFRGQNLPCNYPGGLIRRRFTDYGLDFQFLGSKGCIERHELN